MDICRYCGGEIGPENLGNSAHDACLSEYSRRKDSGLCVSCGEETDGYQCEECHGSGRMEYDNYPGGT